jgi:thiol:disulfide interchange protein DsbG
MMKPFTFALITSLGLVTTACSKPATTPDSPAVSASTAKSPYDLVASSGKGFTVGSLMSTQTVYVLFEPQCPHCGHLWQSSIPLHNKIRFVWIPIAFNSGKSLAQSAALLSSKNPMGTMSEHETLLLSGKGGLAASANVPDELASTIKQNTQLFNSLRLDGVPYILAKNKISGQVITHSGAFTTPALSQFLGI